MGCVVSEKVGKAFVVQEALGFLCGTVVEETPFGLILGADAVMVRDMGPLTQAMRTGQVNECHPVPHVEIKDHAIRYLWPWPHKVPKPKNGSD